MTDNLTVRVKQIKTLLQIVYRFILMSINISSKNEIIFVVRYIFQI